MKNKLLTSIFLLTLGTLKAQILIYSEPVIGNYAMSDMKSLMNDFTQSYNDSGIRAQKTLNFPSSLQLEIGGMGKIEDYKIGGYMNYAKTEGIIAYEDYSGSINDKIYMDRYVIGMVAESESLYGFRLQGKCGISLNQMRFSFNTKIDGLGEETYDHEFSSNGIVLQAAIKHEQKIGPVNLFIIGGYELNSNGQTNSNEIDGAYLTNDEDEKVVLDWSGWRIGLGIEIPIINNKI